MRIIIDIVPAPPSDRTRDVAHLMDAAVDLFRTLFPRPPVGDDDSCMPDPLTGTCPACRTKAPNHEPNCPLRGSGAV